MSDAYTQMLQQMMASGQEMLNAFNPALEKAAGKAAAGEGADTGTEAAGKFAEFAQAFPTMSADMMEMWFGRTFNREGLDAKTRLLLTLGALTAQGALAEPQIRLTVRHAHEAGATEREITETIWQMSMFGGIPAMQKALEIAQSVFAQIKETDA